MGPPLTAEEKGITGSAPWRFKLVGAPDFWAGKQWGQPLPPIESYAAPPQKLAWWPRVVMETEFERGATPERPIQASPLLWNNAFGCLQIMLYPNKNLRLFEDTTGGPTYAGIEE